MSDMKKWMPYRSLVEQDYTYKDKKEKIARPQLSTEKAEEIDRILHTCIGVPLHITYYEDGYLYEIEDAIKKVDMDNKRLVFTSGDKLSLSSITDIEVI
ncbi:MAG: YolD-like family protein [Coprobacillus sp.]|nr:YolD-like family protein [Coprobacillus sp.]